MRSFLGRLALCALLVPACSSKPGPSTGPDSASSTDADVNVAPPDGSDASPDTADVRCPNGQMWIDFPCQKEFTCWDDLNYATTKTQTCADLGYDPQCCSGATCKGGGGGKCAADELCIQNVSDGFGQNDACLKRNCGGPGGASCPQGQVCQLASHQCDVAANTGVCVTPPGGCNYTTCSGSDCAYNCGCDGVTYGERCERLMAGVNLATDGPCCDPKKVGIDPANPSGFTKWEACVGHDGYEKQALAKLAADASCNPTNAGTACDSSEWSCRGDLGGSGPVSDAMASKLCRIATLPFVHKLVGAAGQG